ncbi:MAG: FtsX-like permease family protein [Clostridiales bacterium]|nr:FtsX-like permease family protein [Clostridiales bacterium]
MSAYFKTVARSIKQSLARFVAIFAIIALGVGFLSGLKVSMPSFIKTGNEFVNTYQLYDYRLLSTIGFTEEDVEKLSHLNGVSSVKGAVYYDVMMGDSADSTRLHTVRLHSLTDGVNVPKLIAGRLPEKPDEVVVDEYRLSEEWLGRKLIVLDDNSASAKDALVYDEYTVVGLIRSPYYMNFQRPNTDVGSGSVNFYVYALEDAFDFEYYMEVYVKYSNEYEIFSDEYDAFVSITEKDVERQLNQVIDDRFDGLLEDAYSDLYDARDEFNDKRSENAAELDDARRELLDAAQDLIEGKVELEDAREELADARRTLDDSATQLQDARRRLDSAASQIASGRAQLESAQSEIDSNRLALETARTDLNNNLAAATAGISQAEQTKSELEGNLDMVNATLEGLNGDLADLIALQEQGADVAEQIAQIQAGIEAAEQSKSQIEEGIATCTATIESLNGSIEQINAGLAEVDRNTQALEEAQRTVNASKDELERSVSQYNSGMAEYSRGMSEYSRGEAQYNDGLEEYNRGVEEYNDGYRQYYDGMREFYEGVAEFGDAMCDASRQLEYGFREVDAIRRPDTYVLGRDTNMGYVSFDNDSQIVDGIASVFPIFFFALAALVCSTTMGRMVADERTQIGTMRALGYSDPAIMMKYVIYSGSASISGCCAGYFAGTKVFPYVLWEAYKMMYGFADISYKGSALMFTISMVFSVLCSVGVTVLTCMSELRGMPADLIRPKAPAAGKRILIERITFLWSHFKFLHKVSFRNVFRFKKRMWMMIIGIAGCTSLLITGFGILDSITDIVDYHYDNVMTYDMSVVFDKVREDDIRKAFADANSELGYNCTMALTEIKSMQHQGDDMIRDVSLVITDDPAVTDFIRPREYGTGNPLPWPEAGTVAISSKLADKNGLKAGDTITLTYDDGAKSLTCKISYVFENYIFHYALISEKTYEELTGERSVPDQALISKGSEDENLSAFASELGDNCNVKLWSLTQGMRESFAETMKQLNVVVVLVIACAALLAFIVMFNLNNINITERVREIATLKVMGFNRLETGSYVFRENMILVIIGFVFGIPLGRLLHAFIISQIEMDTVTFITKILPVSYLYSVLLVILFTVIVDLIMRVKIERIDMAESLKSVE